MIDAFPCSGLVMVIKIARMVLMRPNVLHSYANQACFNVKTIKLAFQESEFVMEFLIVAINLMNHHVMQNVVNIVSNVNQPEDVFQTHGNVMEIMIVQMDLMKTQLTLNAIIENVTKTLNSNARMENAFLNYGSVTLMMIVVITQMSLHIDVGIETVPLVGKNVPQEITIDAFLVGCSAMEKMIVEIILMKLILNIVLNVTT